METEIFSEFIGKTRKLNLKDGLTFTRSALKSNLEDALLKKSNTSNINPVTILHRIPGLDL